MEPEEKLVPLDEEEELDEEEDCCEEDLISRSDAEDEKPIVENRLTITKQLFYEGMRGVTGWKKTSLRVVLIFSAVWLAFFIYSLYNGIVVQTFIWFFVLLAAGTYLLVIYPNGRFKKAYRAMEERGAMRRVVKFYEDDFAVFADDDETRFYYEEVLSVMQTKNLYLLHIEDTNVMLARDGFVQGEWETVHAKLRALPGWTE